MKNALLKRPSSVRSFLPSILCFALLGAVVARPASADEETGVLSDFGTCAMIQLRLMKPMPNEPLYETNKGECQAVAKPERRGKYYADAACKEQIYFSPKRFYDFCRDELLDSPRSRERIGNPEKWKKLEGGTPSRETRWDLSHGSQLRVNALDQTLDHVRPFVKKVEFRTVEQCSLGMRIYKNDLSATDLKPLIFFHGGGWKRRGAGAVTGIETAAPNFTAEGYIVFAPFHRLLGDRDGPEACRNANGEKILADAEAALDWVLANGSRYGVQDESQQVAVAGQSSGAYLAAYLATQHPKRVERGLLLYPPADFGFLVDNLAEGGLYSDRFTEVRELLLQFLGLEGLGAPRELATNRLVASSSFPSLIDPAPEDFPPVFLIHGTADRSVPVEPTVRLCEAFDPEESLSKGAYPGGDLVRSCGASSRMHLIAGADHILDLRCFTGELHVLAKHLFGLETLCPAGGPEGERKVRAALREAYGEFFGPADRAEDEPAAEIPPEE